MQTIKPPVNTVVFEVNDLKDRSREYTADRQEYHQLMQEFLESLGFEVEPFGFSIVFLIQGCKIDIDITSASYMTRNPFGRIYRIRKPENRFVRLFIYSEPIAKIFVNKEMDGDKLRKKIQKAIDERKNKERMIQEDNDLKMSRVLDIANHYLQKNPDLRNDIDVIHVEQGVVSFFLHNESIISIRLKDHFIEKLKIPIPQVHNLKELRSFTNRISEIADNVCSICDRLINCGIIESDIAEWTTNLKHLPYYHVQDKKVD